MASMASNGSTASPSRDKYVRGGVEVAARLVSAPSCDLCMRVCRGGGGGTEEGAGEAGHRYAAARRVSGDAGGVESVAARLGERNCGEASLCCVRRDGEGIRDEREGQGGGLKSCELFSQLEVGDS